MTYTIAVCTVRNSWWWTEELSETCRILFQKLIWEISASSLFYYKNLSRCTVTWTSNSFPCSLPEYTLQKYVRIWNCIVLCLSNCRTWTGPANFSSCCYCSYKAVWHAQEKLKTRCCEWRFNLSSCVNISWHMALLEKPACDVTE